jgi:hypothetical protein
VDRVRWVGPDAALFGSGVEVGDGGSSASSSFEDVEVDGEFWRTLGDGFVETEGLDCF